MTTETFDWTTAQLTCESYRCQNRAKVAVATARPTGYEPVTVRAYCGVHGRPNRYLEADHAGQPRPLDEESVKVITQRVARERAAADEARAVERAQDQERHARMVERRQVESRVEWTTTLLLEDRGPRWRDGQPDWHVAARIHPVGTPADYAYDGVLVELVLDNDGVPAFVRCGSGGSHTANEARELAAALGVFASWADAANLTA